MKQGLLSIETVSKYLLMLGFLDTKNFTDSQVLILHAIFTRYFGEDVSWWQKLENRKLPFNELC